MDKKPPLGSKITRLIEKVFLLTWRPFSEAPSLGALADRSFLLFGLLLGTILTLTDSFTNFLSLPLSSLPKGIIDVFLLIGSGISPLISGIPLRYPIAALIVVLYFVTSANRSARRFIGNLTFEVIVSIAEAFVRAGDWCIRHRWGSVSIMSLISLVLFFNISFMLKMQNEKIVAKERLDKWVASIESLIDNTALDGGERSEFASLSHRWDPSFKSILSTEEFETALKIHELFTSLHNVPPGLTWETYLNTRLPSWDSTVKELGESQMRTDDRNIARKLVDFGRILMGRLWTRAAGDSCVDIGNILRADQHLKSISTNDLKSSAVLKNAKGNVFNCAAQAIIYHQSKDLRKRLQSICPDLSSCVSEAILAYQSAGHDSQACGFRDKRLRNNILDLKTKLALSYDLPVVQQASKGDLRKWLSSRKVFGDTIKSEVTALLDCNKQGKTIPTVFVTTAQALGARAVLSSDDQTARHESLRAAGAFLRLAINMRPNDFETWHLACFCAIVSSEEDRTQFWGGYQTLLGQADVDLKYLTRKIGETCT